jgi:hypothetical protein
MRYFIGFFATVLLIIIVIVLVFRGAGGGKPKVQSTSKPIDSYATTDAAVRVTIDGAINATSKHQQVRITVNRDNATFEQLQGYDGNVTKQQNYPNSVAAYETFLLALGHAGFTSGDKTAALHDERGYCALGQRYVFELTQNSKNVERFWSTSCGTPRTYLGDTDLTLRLFKDQIPDYDQLSRGLSF